MCLSNDPPKVDPVVTPPPAETPMALASPYGTSKEQGISELRISSRRNLAAPQGAAGSPAAAPAAAPPALSSQLQLTPVPRAT